MALEPVIPAAGADGNPELADMTRRFWLAAALSLALLAMAMLWHSASPVALWLQLDPRHPGGAVGGRAVLPARLGIGRRTAGSTCSP